MTISNDTEKAIDKTQHPFMIKTFRKLEKRRNFLDIIKGIYEEPTGNIKLNGERLRAVPLRSGTRHRCPLSPLLFNIALEFPCRAIR